MLRYRTARLLVALAVISAACTATEAVTPSTATATATTTTTIPPTITTPTTSTTTTTTLPPTTTTITVPETTTTTEPYLNNFLWKGEPAELGVLINDFGYPNSKESILASGEFVLHYEYVEEYFDGEMNLIQRTFVFFRFDFGSGLIIDLNIGETDERKMNAYRYVDCYVPFDPTAPWEAQRHETLKDDPMLIDDLEELLIPGVRYPLILADLSENINLDGQPDSLREYVQRLVEYSRSVMDLIREGGEWSPPEERILTTVTLISALPIPACVHTD